MSDTTIAMDLAMITKWTKVLRADNNSWFSYCWCDKDGNPCALCKYWSARQGSLF